MNAITHEFAWPAQDEHTAVMGRTGTGKTLMGGHVLSTRDLRHQTNVLIDYKGEVLFDQLERVREIDFELPKHPGLYRLRPTPDENDAVEAWLWKIWERENIGLMVDEGYMIPNQGAYRAILTTGRSKRIPVITLSQRPVEIDRFAFSEASHIVVFDLNDERDEKTVNGFTPRGFVNWLPDSVDGDDDVFKSKRKLLPRWHSRWWNVPQRRPYFMKPVPPPDVIVANIDSQLDPKFRWI